jgi:hypothetical protein
MSQKKQKGKFAYFKGDADEKTKGLSRSEEKSESEVAQKTNLIYQEWVSKWVKKIKMEEALRRKGRSLIGIEEIHDS